MEFTTLPWIKETSAENYCRPACSSSKAKKTKAARRKVPFITYLTASGITAIFSHSCILSLTRIICSAKQRLSAHPAQSICNTCSRGTETGELSAFVTEISALYYHHFCTLASVTRARENSTPAIIYTTKLGFEGS